jgi:hypothetical protein
MLILLIDAYLLYCTDGIYIYALYISPVGTFFAKNHVNGISQSILGMSQGPNGTIYSAAPHSINLLVNAALCTPYRQAPSVLMSAGIFHS